LPARIPVVRKRMWPMPWLWASLYSTQSACYPIRTPELSGSLRRTTDVEQFETKPPHPVEQRMQVNLLELPREHRCGRLDIQLEIVERLAADRPKCADNPDLVRGSCHPDLSLVLSSASRHPLLRNIMTAHPKMVKAWISTWAVCEIGLEPLDTGLA
jgi:hypothetical protein